MTRPLTAFVLATLLAGPNLAVAASTPSTSAEHNPLPSSYAPRPEAKQHAYGAPLGPPPVGLAQVARPTATPAGNVKKAKARVAARAPIRNTKKVAPRNSSVAIASSR